MLKTLFKQNHGFPQNSSRSTGQMGYTPQLDWPSFVGKYTIDLAQSYRPNPVLHRESWFIDVYFREIIPFYGQAQFIEGLVITNKT